MVLILISNNTDIKIKQVWFVNQMGWFVVIVGLMGLSLANVFLVLVKLYAIHLTAADKHECHKDSR